MDLKKLADDLADALGRTEKPAAVVGLTATTEQLLAIVHAKIRQRIEAVFDADASNGSISGGIPVLPLARMNEREFGVVVIAANRGKERLLEAAAPNIRGQPKIVVAGYAHYDFQDSLFHEILSGLSVPSLANGYPNSLPHLYQCLCNASRLKLDGVVAEFGAFRGGTTMFLARTIRRLGQPWKIYAFDTFQGFPQRRSVWDMYDHEDLLRTSAGEVRHYLGQENVEVVEGDIVETAKVLRGRPVVLSFVDTDNYSPAIAALDVVQESTVLGGAILFDHFTGANRFRYTLGERRAAQRLLDDPRYFNLHGTGVFLRQR